MKRQRKAGPDRLSSDDLQVALAEIVAKLAARDVHWHDAYVAALYVAGRRVTAQSLRLGSKIFPLVSRLAAGQREAHTLLHEVEGELGECEISKCQSARRDVRAHARLVERLETRKSELAFAIVPILDGGPPPLDDGAELLPWQRRLGAMCHHLHSVGGLTDREVGLLRTLAEGIAPLFETIKARAASSKQAWRAFAAVKKMGAGN